MQKKVPRVHVVGGGLAGSEAAWQVLSAGYSVTLHEMRPSRLTAAHKTGNLAELVCSNSLKSMSLDSAPGQLKAEMRHLGSLIVAAAEAAKVPAGQALAVDREVFSAEVSRGLHKFSNFERVDAEVTNLPSAEEMQANNEFWLIATGPLTSKSLADSLVGLCGGDQRLYFYDAIAPIIAADSIDMEHVFRASRYGKGDDDYLNLPLDREQYEAFVDAVIAAEKMPLHDFENTQYFEACLPIEVMIERGRETLRFGPLKPVGFTDPKTERRPHAVIQLRMENVEGTMYSMVGFQTKMKWPDQKRVFSMLPALRGAEFLRFGSVHRNTYVKSPDVLRGDFAFRSSPNVFLAGQITGVEGYTESAAVGLLAGRSVVARLRGEHFALPPKSTMIGALARYVTEGCIGDYQPMNANFGLLPPVERRRGESKHERKARQCRTAEAAFATYLGASPQVVSPPT